VRGVSPIYGKRAVAVPLTIRIHTPRVETPTARGETTGESEKLSYPSHRMHARTSSGVAANLGSPD